VKYRHDPNQTTHWPYDSKIQAHLDSVVPFPDEGNALFSQVRKVWNVKQGGLAPRKKTNYRNRGFLDSDDSDSSDDDSLDVDVKDVMSCLRDGQRFKEAVPLSAMIEILSVLWEDD
jgi:hypothetical protein